MPNTDRKQPKIPADILAAILFAIIGVGIAIFLAPARTICILASMVSLLACFLLLFVYPSIEYVYELREKGFEGKEVKVSIWKEVYLSVMLAISISAMLAWLSKAVQLLSV